MKHLLGVSLLASVLTACATDQAPTGPERPATMPASEADAAIISWMAKEKVEGLAYALIEDGRTIRVRAFGKRDASGTPLQTDTVMYGASLTKTMIAYLAADLVAEGRLDLDRPISRYLPRPLPEYRGYEDSHAPWADLVDDQRWQQITPRMLLNHSAGFSNFHWVEPDGKLRLHFTPGDRYAYSGNGFILFQFVLEQGLGLDVQAEVERRYFAPWGMIRSSLIWRPDFRPNLADGWRDDGSVEPHDERSRVRAAGSLDTTIADMARFVAGVMRGPRASRAELFRPQLPIRTASQFPSLAGEAEPDRQVPGLAAGLGTVTFIGPQGSGFFKGGHNDSTGNMLICLERKSRCLVLLGNDVRAERLYPRITALLLGGTGIPWRWEYGNVDWITK